MKKVQTRKGQGSEKKEKSSKPRLVIATDNFLPRWDGVARFLSATLSGLCKKYDVVVIAPNFGHYDHDEYHLVQIPLAKRHFGDIHFAKFSYSIIAREVRKADLVFTQTIGPIGVQAIIAARPKQLVSFVHSLEAELIPKAIGASWKRQASYPLMRWITRMLYNKPHLLLVPSEHVDDQLTWNGITTPKKVVRLGVDTKLFKPGTAKTLRKSLGFEENDIVIGQHGRLAREKDLKTLLRAFLRVQKKHKHAKLMIVAEGLQEIRKDFENRPGVVLPGKQDDVATYLRAMDIFALTSLTETTCLSALEAMSTGLPVVSTPVGFVRDYIIDGKNGFFFPLHDAVGLTEKLEWLIKHPTLAKRMGEKARELVVEKFSWEQTIKELLSALESMKK